MFYAPDYLLVPTILLKDKKITPMDRSIYGAIYFLSQLNKKKCIASNRVIASIAFTTCATVRNSISRLNNLKYIRCKYKDEQKKVREQIIPLIKLIRVSSPDDTSKAGCHQPMTQVSSTNDTRVSSDDAQNKNIIQIEKKYILSQNKFCDTEGNFSTNKYISNSTN